MGCNKFLFFFCVKDAEKETEGTTGQRSLMHWFIPPMPMTDTARPGWNQKSRTNSGMLLPPCESAETWLGSGGSGTRSKYSKLGDRYFKQLFKTAKCLPRTWNPRAIYTVNWTSRVLCKMNREEVRAVRSLVRTGTKGIHGRWRRHSILLRHDSTSGAI